MSKPQVRFVVDIQDWLIIYWHEFYFHRVVNGADYVVTTIKLVLNHEISGEPELWVFLLACDTNIDKLNVRRVYAMDKL